MISKLRTARVVRHPEIPPNDCFATTTATGFASATAIVSTQQGVKLTVGNTTIDVPWANVDWTEGNDVSHEPKPAKPMKKEK